MRWTAVASLRGRILAVVLAVAAAPLVTGVWLAAATALSGETLLRSRLATATDAAASRLGAGWISLRSELQDVADDHEVRSGLGRPGPRVVPARAREAMERRLPLARRLRLLDVDGSVVWSLEDPVGGLTGGASSLLVTVPVYDGVFGPRIATLEAAVDAATLLGGSAPAVAGMVLSATDPETGAPLLATPFDAGLLEAPIFALGGEEWLTARRNVVDPPVQLVAAAPLTPYVEPFRDAARAGLAVLAAVAVAAFGLALLLTGRLTNSLERLAGAADRVSEGHLDERVPDAGPHEIGRVARAFNRMTESLRRTLAELADRRALAAVGEFAASLAHEIRNPLTSIQVDLQMVEERLPAADAVGRELQAQALADLRRLDATLAGALQTARSGRMAATEVSLNAVLRAAAEAALPAVENAGASLSLPGPDAVEVTVQGDRDALFQVTLNLLLNAAQAVSVGGTVRATHHVEGDAALIEVSDDGRGIPEAELERVFETLYSTRTGGTGLGLAIARRLAEAHGGTLTLASRPGSGTTAVVRLPRYVRPAGE